MMEMLEDYKDVNILKKTMCNIGCHVWVWTTNTTETENPSGGLLCDCGMYRHDEVNDATNKITLP